jgi:hypothetical protein
MPITRAEYAECKFSAVAYPQRRRQISEFTQVSCTVNITSSLSAQKFFISNNAWACSPKFRALGM